MTDEPVQVVMIPEHFEDYKKWLASRRLQVFRMPDFPEDLVTYGVAPDLPRNPPELRWIDGWGYRCPECKLFVAEPHVGFAVHCPRCPTKVPR